MMIATVTSPQNALFIFCVGRVDQNHAASQNLWKTAHSASVDTQTAGDIELAPASSGTTLNLRISTSAALGQLIPLGAFKNGLPFILGLRLSSGVLDGWVAGLGQTPQLISATYQHGSGFNTNRVRLGLSPDFQTAHVLHEFLIASTLPGLETIQRSVIWAMNRYFASPLVQDEAAPMFAASPNFGGQIVRRWRWPIVSTDGVNITEIFGPSKTLASQGLITAKEAWSGATFVHSGVENFALTLPATMPIGYAIDIFQSAGSAGVVDLVLDTGAINQNGFSLAVGDGSRLGLIVLANADGASAQYIGTTDSDGLLASLSVVTGDVFDWGVVELNASAGNVTLDGTSPEGLIWVTGNTVPRNLTITPEPAGNRTIAVYNAGTADLAFIDHAAATIATLAGGQMRVFTWAASAWAAQFVWPGQGVGGGGGLTGIAYDVPPVDVGAGATMTTALHGREFVSGGVKHKRKVRLRHASNQATAFTVTVADGLADEIMGTVAPDQTGLVTVQRQTSATINGGTSVVLAGPGASFLIIPGPTNIYHLEGETAEPITAQFKGYSETLQIVSTVGGVATIDYALGNVVRLPLTANIATLNFTNLPATGIAANLAVKITQGAGPFSIAWPASVRWAGGTAPTLSAANGAIDWLTFETDNGGTDIDGFTAGQAMT